MSNRLRWKQLADDLGVDYSSVDQYSLDFESTWIRLLGKSLTGVEIGTSNNSGSSLKNAIQNEVANMPDQESLVGLWFLDYDVVANEGDANNQRVFDWSGNGNHGWRGDSTTPNTSSPEGSSFSTGQFVRMPYDPSVYTAENDPITLGGVAKQNFDATSYIFARNSNRPSLVYISDGRAIGYVNSGVTANENRVLNTVEHYMVAGSGSALYMFKNGVSNGFTNSSSYNADALGQHMWIGRAESGFYFDGNIYCVYLYTSDQSSNAALINTTINNMLTELGGQ